MRHLNIQILGVWAMTLGCGGYEKSLEVRNTPPSVTIQAPSAISPAFREGEPLEFRAIVGDDADLPSDLALTWSSDLLGVFEDTSSVDDESGQVVWTTAALDVGVHVMVLEVVDSKGEAAQDSVDVEIEAASNYPDIAMVHPTGDEAGFEDEEFEFVVQVGDEQDDLEMLRVEFFVDDDPEPFCAPMPDLIGVAKCDWSLEVGDRHLVFKVTDTDGNSRETADKLFVVEGLEDPDEIDNDGDGFTENQGDCDDNDASVYPGAIEVENGVDDDCDGIIDEGTNAYDDDGDGYSENEGDCDDTDASVTFDDCDGDGYVSIVYGGEDCDDADPDVHPAAPEQCDLIDNNCDGQVDEAGAAGCSVYFEDLDEDGYGSTVSACVCGPTGSFSSSSATDCYDDNSAANPAYSLWATTDRGDGSFDWDCSGSIEEEHGTSSGECSCSGTVLFGICLGSCDFSYGWNGGAPTCGTSGTFITDCDAGLLDSCDASTETRSQGCR
jgi:hypothetical protein